MVLKSISHDVANFVIDLIAQVMAVRLAPEDLLPLLPQLSEGLLIWIGDSKNRFKSKIRTIVERLVRRCGYDAVAAAVPKEHAALLEHIRREQGREDKRKRAGSVASGAPGREAAAPHGAWDHDEVFSVGGTTAAGGARGRAARSERDGGRGGAAARSEATGRSARRRVGGAAGSGADFGGGEEGPLDLMDESQMRRRLLRRSAGSGGRVEEDDGDYGRGADGRIMVTEDGGKRKRGDGEEGLEGGDEDVPYSQSGRSARSASARSGRGGGKAAHGAGGKEHGGERFRAKKAAGDVSRQGGVQPYAYWPMDAKMLNRREAKKRTARTGLDRVVSAAKAGAAAAGGRKGGGARKGRQ